MTVSRYDLWVKIEHDIWEKMRSFHQIDVLNVPEIRRHFINFDMNLDIINHRFFREYEF